MITTLKQKRIFSGVQPSGQIHIGNYLGAIKNWIKLQDEYESIFCIVDLHAITILQKPEELKKKILEVAAIYLAAGIDPEKSIIFIQSQVPAHTELTWILNCLTRVPELERMTQFKDKAKKQRTKTSVGLFDYPVLMAADILLYQTEVVPVGQDQEQHVELARTLAKRFNQLYGETLIVPKALIRKESARIMGLDDPLKKMSKSADNPYNYIALTDAPDLIRDKIKKAVTDSGKEIKYSPDKPAIANLIAIYQGLTDLSFEEIEKKYHGKSYVEFKNDLAEVIIKALAPLQKKMEELVSRPDYLLGILKQGSQKAELIAQKTLIEVKKKIGLI